MSVSTRITTAVVSTHTSPNSFATGSIRVEMPSQAITYADGSGDGQINRIYRADRSLAASASENLDLYDFAGATDALGNTYALSKVKILMIRNTSTDNASTLTVGAAASNPWTGPLGGTTPTITLTPAVGWQGALILTNPAGWTVTDASAHLLKVLNNDGTNTATYEILVGGSQ